MSLEDDAKRVLAALEQRGQLRTPRVVDTPAGPRVVVDGLSCLNLSSNDYLGLANDRRIVEAAVAALARAGLGASSSRLVVGNHREHHLLEAAIRNWLGVSGALLFNSGYAANVGVLSTLALADDVVFSDELNHASIIDGCRLSRARVVIYAHGRLDELERSLRSTPCVGRRFLVSETVFSMDGNIADVEGLDALARSFDAALILDEAHAVGASGPNGRGVAASCNVRPDVLVGTFGKALGSFGAFVATSKSVADLLWNRARSFVFSTGLPPALAAASRAAIDIVSSVEGDQLRQALDSRISRLRAVLEVPGSTAIVPWLVGDEARAMALTATLLENGVYAQGIRPPTVPRGTSRLRLSLSAAHALDAIEHAAWLIRAARSR